VSLGAVSGYLKAVDRKGVPRGGRSPAGCDSISEGLQVASERIDLAISDEQMPRMNGLTLLERARSLAPEATRLLLTGFPDAELVREALGKRIAHHVMLKPWDDAVLKAKIDSVLGGT